MKLYNSLSGKVEEFKPINEGQINMYVCGPTVYNYAHVGNMYPVVVFDMMYRYFKYRGYDVKYASNFTDVDDKIIKAALELGITEKELTEKYINIYLEDVKALNCLDIDYRPKVTETMDEIIQFIQDLLDKDFAYKRGDDVYFRVSAIKEYGEISKQVIDDLAYGNRIEVSDNKENPFDFVLWKKTNEGITWDAPFGEGRPGWHTECVVMINNIFGKKIDIHGGGVDLKFPHHENEQAQNRAHNDCELANYWMHSGHVMVDGVKMSKSLGNFMLARDLIERYPVNIIRLAILKNGYRAPFDFTDKLFHEAETIDTKVKNALKQANLYLNMNNTIIDELGTDEKVNEIMDNDLNTPNLITYLLDLVKVLNTKLRNNENIISEYKSILIITDILGLVYDLPILSDDEKEIYGKWLEYRNKKEFDKADELRVLLVNKGII